MIINVKHYFKYTTGSINSSICIYVYTDKKGILTLHLFLIFVMDAL